MIRLNTASTAPSILGKISKAAREASKDLRALSRALGLLNQPLDRVEPKITALGRAFNAMRMQGTDAFTQTARSAAFFSRTAVSVGRTSSASLDGVTATLSRVRQGANQTTAAFNSMALAAHRVPRAIGSPRVGGAGASGGSGNGGAGGGGFAMSPGMLLASGIGVGAGDALFHGVRGAADLQDAEIQTGIAMGRSNSWVAQNLRPLAMQMSMSTAQSVTDSMGLLRTMATSGINDPNQLRELAMPIAQFADTQYLGKNHVAFQDTASSLAGLAHQLNLRSPADLTRFTNALFKVSNDMPDSLATAATQIGYYGASYAGAGVSPEEIVKLQATADRMGLGKRKSGTGMNMIYRALLHPTTDKMIAAQAGLGLLDASGGSRFIDAKTGVFNPEALFNALNQQGRIAKREGHVRSFEQMLQQAFPTNAALIANAMSSDTGRAQRRNVDQTFNRVQSASSAQQRLMGSLNNQTKLLTSNFATLMTNIANPLIPQLTTLVGHLATLTGNLANYYAAHPGAAKATAFGLAGIAAAGSIAALIVGGYVADSVFHGAPFRIARAAGHSGSTIARRVLGLPMTHVGAAAIAGTAAKGSVLGRVAGGARDLLGFGAFGAGKGLFGDVIKEFTALRIASVAGHFGLESIVGVFARLGLKAIPVVGEILMLADTLHLLMGNSKNIGHLFGQLAVYVADNLPKLIAAAGPAAGSAMISLLKYIIDAINPMNWWHAIQDARRGFQDAFDEAHGKRIDGRKLPGAPYGWQGPAAVRMGASGHNPIYSEPGLHLPAARLPGPRVNGGTSASTKSKVGTVSIVINHNGNNVHQLAQRVAAVIADNFGLDIRSGSAIPGFAGDSSHAVLAGIPS